MSFRKLLPNRMNGDSSSSLRRCCCKTLNAEKFSVIKSRYLLSLYENKFKIIVHTANIKYSKLLNFFTYTDVHNFSMQRKSLLSKI